EGTRGQLHGHTARAGLEAQLGGAQTAEAGDRVAHTVDGELRPALAPEVRGHLGRRYIAEHAGQLLGARRVAAVQLAEVEADGRRIRADRVARLVHPRADHDHAPERALAADPS